MLCNGINSCDAYMAEPGPEVVTNVAEETEQGVGFQRGRVDICGLFSSLKAKCCQKKEKKKLRTPQTHSHYPLLLWLCVLKNTAVCVPKMVADTEIAEDN